MKRAKLLAGMSAQTPIVKDLYHNKTMVIKCIECGGKRTIFKQDRHHVKRCLVCQSKFRNKRHKRALTAKAIKERANVDRRASELLSAGPFYKKKRRGGKRKIGAVQSNVVKPQDQVSCEKIIL